MGGGEQKLATQLSADDNDGAAVCQHHPSLQQIVWHTKIMGVKNSAPPPSYASDENDGAAVCKH